MPEQVQDEIVIRETRHRHSATISKNVAPKPPDSHPMHCTRKGLLPNPFPLPLQAVLDLLTHACQIASVRCPGVTLQAGDLAITDVVSAQHAQATTLSFYKRGRNGCAPNAGVCLLKEAELDDLDASVLPIFVDSPKDSFFSLVDHLYPGAQLDDWSLIARGDLAPPVIADDAQVAETAVIAPGVVIESGCVICPQATIGPGCHLGQGTVCEPQSVVSHLVTGQDVLIKSVSVIGSLGFGFYQNSKTQKVQSIPHLGGVRIGARAHIGANVCIDRGVLSETTIGSRTLIGNQAQIGHNCQIGDDVVMMSFAGISGSTQIGDRAALYGAVRTKDHVCIGQDTIILGATNVTTTVPPGATHAGYYNLPAGLFHRMYTKLKQLAKS